MYWGVVVFETLCWLVFFFSMLGDIYVPELQARTHSSRAVVRARNLRDVVDRGAVRQRHVRAVSPRLPPAPGDRANRDDSGTTAGDRATGLHHVFPVAGAYRGRSRQTDHQALQHQPGEYPGRLRTGRWHHLGCLDRRPSGAVLASLDVLPRGTGFAISNGMGLCPAYIPLAMAAFIVFAAVVVGNTTPDGESVVDVWAKSRTTSPGTRLGLQAIAYIVLCNVVYAADLPAARHHQVRRNVDADRSLGSPPGQNRHATGIRRPAVQRRPRRNHHAGPAIGCVALTRWWAKRTDRSLIAPTLASVGAVADRAPSLAT